MAAQPPQPVRHDEHSIAVGASPRHAMLRALRTPGDEVQLTKVIGAMAAVDPDFATGFVQAVLDQAEHDFPGHKAARKALGDVPERVVGRIEHYLVGSDGRKHGRADLVFTDADRLSAFTLLIENKLYAVFHEGQMAQYRDWAMDKGGHAAVVAITRDLPTRGDLAPGEPTYLGSVRWGELYTRLMDLSFDAGAREQWRRFLEVLNDQGDLGMTQFDPEAVRAWAKAGTGREMLARLLGNLARSTETHTREQLANEYPEDKEMVDQLAELRNKGDVKTWEQDGLSFFVSMPAGSHTGFHVHAWAEAGELSFGITVSADDDPYRQEHLALKNGGLLPDESTGGRWYTTHPADAVLDADDADRPATLASLVEDDITTLVASRFLDKEVNHRVSAPDA